MVYSSGKRKRDIEIRGSSGNKYWDRDKPKKNPQLKLDNNKWEKKK